MVYKSIFLINLYLCFWVLFICNQYTLYNKLKLRIKYLLKIDIANNINTIII